MLVPMRAPQLAIEFTLQLLERTLPRAPARLLEVGAGDGALARALQDRGHRVVALDLDAEAVAAARARGVDAHVARFPDLPAGLAPTFDAVLFTRSLHHIHPLDSAVRQAAALMSPTGRVVVEDWAWNQVDDATARWMYALAAEWRTRGLAPADEFVHEGDPLGSWLREHERDCHLHRDTAMREALLASFAPLPLPLEGERVPYFFRYACRWLAGREDGLALSRALLERERELLARGEIVPIGWRWVGTPRSR